MKCFKDTLHGYNITTQICSLLDRCSASMGEPERVLDNTIERRVLKTFYKLKHELITIFFIVYSC